jgi:hypothetical protein
MRVIGLDVHRSFAQVAELENGVLRQRGRVDLVRHKVLAFGVRTRKCILRTLDVNGCATPLRLALERVV